MNNKKMIEYSDNMKIELFTNQAIVHLNHECAHEYIRNQNKSFDDIGEIFLKRLKNDFNFTVNENTKVIFQQKLNDVIKDDEMIFIVKN